jgi:hypothetical protein
MLWALLIASYMLQVSLTSLQYVPGQPRISALRYVKDRHKNVKATDDKTLNFILSSFSDADLYYSDVKC